MGGIEATLWRGHRIYQVARWRDLPLVHGFGTRNFDMALAFQAERFSCPRTQQVHGSTVQVLEESRRTVLQIGDAFLTAQPGMLCFVRTADCVPILLCAPRHRVVGAVHAGWRGLAAGIMARTLATLWTRFRIPVQSIEWAVGPAITGREYEIDAPVIAALKAGGHCLDEATQISRTGHWWLDLRRVVTGALCREGVLPDRIVTTPLSTYQRPGEFHSSRRSPRRPGRQYSFIGWRSVDSCADIFLARQVHPDQTPRHW